MEAAAGSFRKSIRWKLAWLVIASVGAAVTIVTGVTAWSEGRRSVELQAEKFKAEAALVASVSAEATAAGDRAGAFYALRGISKLPDITYARVEALNGIVLAETGSGVRLASDASLTSGKRGSLLSLLHSRSIQTRADIVHGRDKVGQIVLLGTARSATGRLLGSLMLSALAGLCATLIGLLVAWRLQRQIVSPILALRDRMGEVRATHDYSGTVEITGGEGEIGALVDGFNAMLGQIGERDQAIARHVTGLEATVSERTADLRLAKDAAESANAAKSDFLATMSHEIRTPMNGIMVMAEMLAGGEMPPKQRRFAEVIAKSGSSLLAIINDLLDFSKIEAGKMELETVAVDPAEIAEDVASLFWEKAASKGLDLACYIDPATPALVEADPVRLRQVVGNLTNNAIKFTEAGGVLISVEPAPDGLRIAIQDTGIGIPKDKIPTVFGAFSQADQSTTRRFGGTGLGLAICNRLVETMGGAFDVKSQVGKGSIFAFTFPTRALADPAPWPQLTGQAAVRLEGVATQAATARYLASSGLSPSKDTAEPVLSVESAAAMRGHDRTRAPVICIGAYGDASPAALVRDGRADAALVQPLRRRELAMLLGQVQAGQPLTDPATAETAQAQTALPQFDGCKVLVADDSAVNREVAIEALSRLNIQCDCVEDGRQAVEAALGCEYALVLMDGSMPEMDGYEATRLIRAREGDGRRTPIVALTAHVVGSAAEAWRDAGMDGVLHKPFTLAALANVVAGFVKPTSLGPTQTSKTAEAMGAGGELLDSQVIAELRGMAQGGRQDFVDKIFRLYRENSPALISRLFEASENEDWEEGAKAAHALKSMSLNVGAKAVSAAAGRIETRARMLKALEGAAVEAIQRQLAATLEALAASQAGASASPPPAPAVLDDQALLAELAHAAERGEFELAYQPQFDKTGAIVGVEALLRWTHPTRGPVSPARFIPLAERAGLIRPITRWVLDRALAETSGLGQLKVAVNASALEFSDPSFGDEVIAALARHGYDPRRLEIEITETAVLEEGEEARTALERFQGAGIAVALDDFGMGSSSLNQLRLNPFNKLKNYRSFTNACPEDLASA
ncbi:MAG: hypothetical protein JWM33_3737, partial [Caulobacteraceae bacterium]|nr:hypothetical protein [Caulobacteraceae bacterium]